MVLAARPPRKQEINEIINYLTRRVDELGIEVCLNKKFDTDSIKEFHPDVLVLAVGGKFTKPDIKGIDCDNLKTASQVLQDDSDVGKKVIIIGGGLVGLETAEYLIEKGKQIIPSIGSISQHAIS